MGNKNNDLKIVLLHLWRNSSSTPHFIFDETGPEILSTLMKNHTTNKSRNRKDFDLQMSALL